ncbi:MAG: eukaryotic-like serine/threonine-protein kinase [Solirubrobacteraceae bacterium]|nr:eukaryotic-like serine/threonine-protein kinase [Solirubrobacteraceae bacterium]
MPATEQQVALPPRYRVVRHIANGGMASVWVAEDELLGRLVAVKLLSRAYDSDDRARRRFLREARAAARLGDCRHVVTVYDIGEHDDRAFMVMEYFPGGTLADRLRRHTVIPRALAVRWLRETAIALDCAHEHDVVHRDVKPANLLLDQRGRLAVGDFGIATVASEASVTQTGQVLGTAAYLSPEQARGHAATAASDRYALAVVAFELLTGTRPFAAEHPAAQARAHVEATVPSASAAAEGLPAAVDHVLTAGMAKEPDDRPASAAELVDRLEQAIGDGGGASDDARTAVTRQFIPIPAATPRAPAGRPAPTTGAGRPGREPRATRTPPPPAAPSPVAAGGPRRRGAWIAALAALGLAAGAVVAIAMTSAGGGTRTAERASSGQSDPTAATPRTERTQSTAAAQPAAAEPQSTASTQPRRSRSASAGRSTAGDPGRLNDQGFALIQQGNNAAAVPLLRQSVQGFRDRSRTSEINYAFALFNLASALRATGRPGEAIPLLEERLRISDYKTAVVQRELALSRRQAGVAGGAAPSTPSPTPGKARGRGNGNANGHTRDEGDD